MWYYDTDCLCYELLYYIIFVFFLFISIHETQNQSQIMAIFMQAKNSTKNKRKAPVEQTTSY